MQYQVISVYSRIAVLGELANFEGENLAFKVAISYYSAFEGDSENFRGKFYPLKALK